MYFTIPQSLLIEKLKYTKTMRKDKKRKGIPKEKEWLSFNNAIALLLVLAIITILKSVFEPIKIADRGLKDLEEEAETLLYTLTNEKEEVSLLGPNELLEERVRELGEMDYDEIKNILGLKQDFCIFFEDISGNLVNIANINPGIGSNKIYVNGNPCK